MRALKVAGLNSRMLIFTHSLYLSVSLMLPPHYLACSSRCLFFFVFISYGALSLFFFVSPPLLIFSFRMRGGAIRCRRRCSAVQPVSMGSRSVEGGCVELVRARACIEG